MIEKYFVRMVKGKNRQRGQNRSYVDALVQTARRDQFLSCTATFQLTENDHSTHLPKKAVLLWLARVLISKNLGLYIHPNGLMLMCLSLVVLVVLMCWCVAVDEGKHDDLLMLTPLCIDLLVDVTG
jgi:hypothetical protein